MHMGLYTKQSNSKIADKDIICYKSLVSLWQGSKIVYAPYFPYAYEIGKLHSIRLGRVKDSHVKYGFHTCADADFCISYGYIYQCIIPKGSRYYEGSTVIEGIQFNGYVSNRLIVKGKV